MNLYVYLPSELVLACFFFFIVFVIYIYFFYFQNHLSKESHSHIFSHSHCSFFSHQKYPIEYLKKTKQKHFFSGSPLRAFDYTVNWKNFKRICTASIRLNFASFFSICQSSTASASVVIICKRQGQMLYWRWLSQLLTVWNTAERDFLLD